MKRKTTQHTPGPWIAVGAWVEHSDDEVADICTCDPDALGQNLDRPYSEICANARLIAAAPALLSTLKDLIGLAYDLCPDDPDMYEFDERIGNANDLIKAIEKEN